MRLSFSIVKEKAGVRLSFSDLSVKITVCPGYLAVILGAMPDFRRLYKI